MYILDICFSLRNNLSDVKFSKEDKIDKKNGRAVGFSEAKRDEYRDLCVQLSE